MISEERLLHNLPEPLSAFIGREREILEVKRLLVERRLLTLTGSGGSGKTRLALEAARGFWLEGLEGIWFVEFGALSDEQLVPQAIASALAIREQPGGSLLDSLSRHLSTRNALLVLDNCEHLVNVIAHVCMTLLAACPGLRILATSREPLGLSGEVIWTVPPLSLPEPQPWRSPHSDEEVLKVYIQSEAVQLFVARAKLADPGFTLNRSNASWTAEICRRLDGIPLAIELAAARMRAFTARQIVERLDDRFRLLTTHLRDVHPRYQALQASLDWSYQLLPESEQVVFQCLSVFAPGWTLEAAEAVCAVDEISSENVMDLLGNLVDKSLVMLVLTHGQKRYRLLETIRQYASQKLADARQADLYRDRHLEYYLWWAEENAKLLTGRNQTEGVGLFAADHDNLRTALEWSQVAPGRGQLGLRLAGACEYYWRLGGHFSEGREHLLAALSLSDTQEPNSARALALLCAAHLAYVQSDYPATKKLAEEGLGIYQDLGSEGKFGAAKTLALIGELDTEVGDYEAAPGLFEEALRIFRELGSKRESAEMLMQLGWARMRSGNYVQAESYLRESMPLIEEQGDLQLLGFVLGGLGELAIRQGKLAQAQDLLERSLAISLGLDPWLAAASFGSLGWIALLKRDFEGMKVSLGESLRMRAELHDQGGIAWCLEKLGQAAAKQGEYLLPVTRRKALVKGAQLFGAASALRSPLNSVIDPADQPEYLLIRENLKNGLGEQDFQEAWKAGEELPIEKLIDFALAPVLTPEEAAALSSRETNNEKFGGLTNRECEVAVLITEGKTNREIAEEMVVREKTVETYITRILYKLGFHSRVQVATWALEVGLAETVNHN